MGRSRPSLIRKLYNLLPKREPTGKVRAVCSECGDMVLVGDGLEWEDGDVCHLCSTEILRKLENLIIKEM